MAKTRKTFEAIKEEINAINRKIKGLESKSHVLQGQLQEVCQHPQEERYDTAEDRKCAKCGKNLGPIISNINIKGPMY